MNELTAGEHLLLQLWEQRSIEAAALGHESIKILLALQRRATAFQQEEWDKQLDEGAK